MSTSKYTFIRETIELDPVSGHNVRMEVWRDNESNGIFAIDSTFLDQVDVFFNPFNGDRESAEESLALPSKSS